MENTVLQLVINDSMPSYLKLKRNERYINIIDQRYHINSGISSIASLPTNLGNGQISNVKIVILIHGHQSHKDAIYQPLLAELLSDLGYCVIRFDFRGQGDSEPNTVEEIGRTIEQDINDLDSIMSMLDETIFKDFIFSSLSNLNNEVLEYIDIKLEMIVAHSRGALVMFEYLRRHSEIYVPLIVDCCGRFYGEGLLNRYNKFYPNWKAENGFLSKTFRYGKYSPCWVPQSEVISTASVNTGKFNELNEASHVLLVYGSCDNIIPIEDATAYTRLFEGRYTFIKLEGADHNFYGLDADPNINGLPIRRGKVNYSVQFVHELINFLRHWQKTNT